MFVLVSKPYMTKGHSDEAGGILQHPKQNQEARHMKNVHLNLTTNQLKLGNYTNEKTEPNFSQA